MRCFSWIKIRLANDNSREDRSIDTINNLAVSKKTMVAYYKAGILVPKRSSILSVSFTDVLLKITLLFNSKMS